VEDSPDVPLAEFTPPTDAEWKEACEALLKGAPFDKVMFTKTYEGITFDPMYTKKHTEDILPKSVMPGMGDYLRGVDPAGYIGKPWGIAQACDETLPAENNELLRHENDKGSTIYHIVLDTASRAGVDARQAEKVGDIGTSVTTVDDMHTLLEGFRDNQGNKQRAITYTADFFVTYADGRHEVIEVKGMRTRDYLLRKKLFLHMMRDTDIIFREVR